MKREELYARIIAVALFVAILAGTWDVWWHGAVGRDTLWEAPHLLLYASTIVAIATGIYGWKKTKDKLWERLAIVLVIVPLSAPFDELWHTAFGVEDLTSPLAVWSPPHIAIALAIIAAFIMVLPIILRDKDPIAKRFFGSLVLAGILNLALFLMSPIEPTGPWALLGFWGAAFGSLVLITIFFSAEKLIPGVAPITLLAFIMLTIAGITFGEQLAPGVEVAAHDHAPTWVTIASFLIPAAFLDLTKKWSLIIRGAIAGGLWAGLIYFLSRIYFETQFQYSLGLAGIGLVAGIAGGIIASLILLTLPAKLTKTT